MEWRGCYRPRERQKQKVGVLVVLDVSEGSKLMRLELRLKRG